MCGIVGKVSLTDADVSEAEVMQMRDTLAHRGPDDAGVYISRDKKIGLGHRRLRIIDLTSAGHQPMSYRDRYRIVYNGEIYNYQKLRKDLVKAGYTFTSRTDTEVILALYDKYREGCLQYLRGMFAFALYDEREQVLFCARDRIGQKPFKYYYDGKTLLFASELKAILTQPEYRIKNEPDWIAIHHYLTYQYVPSPRTGFQHINKLRPAHYLRLDINNQKLDIRRYWQLNGTRKENYNESEWIRRLTAKLDESVQLQMISDVPIGAFLSGGIDSSSIVALMHHHTSRPIKTFSIGFAEEPYNELSYARQVAEKFKTDHTEFVIKPDILELLPQLISAYEEPYADSSAIPMYYLSKLARAHVTVALNGDAGDENFAGYSRYNFHKLALLLDQVGLSYASGLPRLGQALDRIFQNTFSLRAQRFLESLPDHYLRRYVTYYCYYTNEMKRNLYTQDFSERTQPHDSYDLTITAGAAPELSRFEQALHADIAMYLPDDLLVKVDIASMMVSLEARSPFLDHEFMELAAHVPNAVKLRGLTGNKYILKQMMRTLLPGSIINRPKQGFILPIERWFRDDMNAYLRATLLGKNTLITKNMFQRSAVRALIDRHTKTRTNLAPPLWALLTLELWLREYFPNV